MPCVEPARVSKERVPLPLVLLILLWFAHLPARAESDTEIQKVLASPPADRIHLPIDDGARVVLRGNVHPLARRRYDVGEVPADFRMEKMILTLKPDSQQQANLAALIEAEHNPESHYYHQWLTPEELGEHFGIAKNDLDEIVEWLQSHGMKIDEFPASRREIVFSGTAAQVESAFHTPIHAYNINGENHHANIKNPEIPRALAGVVGGVVSLHDFRSQPMHTIVNAPTPDFSNGNSHFLAPADFSTIYDVAPLYQQAINGTGQSIAIVARSNINLADVQQFRRAFGLSVNNPQVIVNGNNPGIVSSNEEVEATLDTEWAGAVARNATIKFVVSASTSSTDGVYLSTQYIVNHNLAPVMSMSFGLCEAALGSSGNSFISNLWQQAAAEGITVLVSSGDSGAAGCDTPSATKATDGRAVNGLCSSPYNVCVGGTEFNDTKNSTLYWASSNAGGTQGSALGYIPEIVWNESGSSGLWASGGGASSIYGKPSWQTGTGVPADGRRDVPDVSLSAASHDGYLIYMNGSLLAVGGTSAAAPSFAGLMALVAQSTGARQGNANPHLYALASKQHSGGAAVFHDITSGNNSVAGVTGYNAGAGYDWPPAWAPWMRPSLSPTGNNATAVTAK
jgi:pseudomonalisin